MARAGKSVCLLERGEERWPGEYPTATIETVKQYRVTGHFIPNSLGGIGVNMGNPTGMFHLILGHDQNVISANGKFKMPINPFMQIYRSNLQLYDHSHRTVSHRIGRHKSSQFECIPRNRTRYPQDGLLATRNSR